MTLCGSIVAADGGPTECGWAVAQRYGCVAAPEILVRAREPPRRFLFFLAIYYFVSTSDFVFFPKPTCVFEVIALKREVYEMGRPWERRLPPRLPMPCRRLDQIFARSSVQSFISISRPHCC